MLGVRFRIAELTVNMFFLRIAVPEIALLVLSWLRMLLGVRFRAFGCGFWRLRGGFEGAGFAEIRVVEAGGGGGGGKSEGGGEGGYVGVEVDGGVPWGFVLFHGDHFRVDWSSEAAAKKKRVLRPKGFGPFYDVV